MNKDLQKLISDVDKLNKEIDTLANTDPNCLLISDDISVTSSKLILAAAIRVLTERRNNLLERLKDEINIGLNV